jgi:hypothetical protein
MDARKHGYGMIVPVPRYLHSQLGNVVHVDVDGIARSYGTLFDDLHFKNLVKQSKYTVDRTTTEERYPSILVALTTSAMGVKPLTEEERSV